MARLQIERAVEMAALSARRVSGSLQSYFAVTGHGEIADRFRVAGQRKIAEMFCEIIGIDVGESTYAAQILARKLPLPPGRKPAPSPTTGDDNDQKNGELGADSERTLDPGSDREPAGPIIAAVQPISGAAGGTPGSGKPAASAGASAKRGR